MNFGTYHIWANSDTMGLNSDLSLNLHIYSLCMGAAMDLANLHIYTGSTKASIVSHCDKYQNQMCWLI